VLVFVGAKMLLSWVYQVPIMLSLAFIATLLAGAVVASLLWPTKKPELPSQRSRRAAPDKACAGRP
jgi:predicted tellurium resistance membrane protein TerC